MQAQNNSPLFPLLFLFQWHLAGHCTFPGTSAANSIQAVNTSPTNPLTATLRMRLSALLSPVEWRWSWSLTIFWFYIFCHILECLLKIDAVIFSKFYGYLSITKIKVGPMLKIWKSDQGRSRSFNVNPKQQRKISCSSLWKKCVICLQHQLGWKGKGIGFMLISLPPNDSTKPCETLLLQSCWPIQSSQSKLVVWCKVA